jgi:hypothetical protein
MEGDNIFQMNLMSTWKNEVFKKINDATIPHNEMGLLKRKNTYIAEITRAMLNNKNLPNWFWVKVVATIVYIMNWTFIITIHGMTPKE